MSFEVVTDVAACCDVNFDAFRKSWPSMRDIAIRKVSDSLDEDSMQEIRQKHKGRIMIMLH